MSRVLPRALRRATTPATKALERPRPAGPTAGYCAANQARLTPGTPACGAPVGHRWGSQCGGQYGVPRLLPAKAGPESLKLQKVTGHPGHRTRTSERTFWGPEIATGNGWRPHGTICLAGQGMPVFSGKRATSGCATPAVVTTFRGVRAAAAEGSHDAAAGGSGTEFDDPTTERRTKV